MNDFIFFIILFVILFLIYALRTLIKTRRKTLKNMGEITYLINRFKLDEKKLNYKSLAYIVSFINSFIISLSSSLISAINLYYIWQLMIGFVLLISLIYSLYGILGVILKRKGMSKNV
jgi:hypothetical protein